MPVNIHGNSSIYNYKVNVKVHFMPCFLLVYVVESIIMDVNIIEIYH